MPVYLFYLSLLLSLCLCELSNFKMIQMADMEHLRLADNAGVVVSTTSVVQCARECVKDLSFKSLSYHSVKGKCLLYPFVFSNDTVGAIGEDGWESYKGSCPTNCGYMYNQTLDWCYRLVEGNKRNATGAVVFCRLDEARMIRINSLERQLHMIDLLFSLGVTSVWIGGHSENQDDNFVYEDSTTMSYFNWAAGNPIGRSYIKMKANGNFSWENSFGTGQRDFLCEW